MRALIALALMALPAFADPVSVTDRRGPQTFDAPPARIATLDWSITEALLDLGVTPVGVAEPRSYADWVVEPTLPEGAVDLGLRAEPNLEALAALAPDAIVSADLDPALIPALERIAPVVIFDAFDAKHDNVQAARDIFLNLGALTGKRAEAEAMLAAQDREIDAIAARLADHFRSNHPKVTAIRLNDATSVYVNGANSVPEYVLARLGFQNELPQPVNRWGITLLRVDDLAAAENGIVLTIGPDMTGAALRKTPVWSFLPFVQAGRIAEVRPVWSYGGAMSQGRMAKAFEEALMTIPPEAVAP
ncbi:MAG: iron-hydroxamate ABC transporter substrate-binding protein [Cereibacter sphaeroides]|uniref:Iron-hydroxamate ABC transporter substrate-binding protein n=1 Tax=Cereibacter sphaeroides TaxID=1063 RepID=A0A2W5SAR7_CERSP|nr:MAG: iron-hydroxamate ABC transporter substrate-binding protein [Cereibacter sphaeroides]